MVSLVTQKSTGFLLVFYSIDCMVFQGIIRAMKTIKKNSLILEEEKKIFSELVILKGLDHPHIVKLYELFQDFENYYLITDFTNEIFRSIFINGIDIARGESCLKEFKCMIILMKESQRTS